MKTFSIPPKNNSHAGTFVEDPDKPLPFLRILSGSRPGSKRRVDARLGEVGRLFPWTATTSFPARLGTASILKGPHCPTDFGTPRTSTRSTTPGGIAGVGAVPST